MSLVVPSSDIVAISNYGELLEAVHDFMDRGDLGTKIDGYIRLVEGRINREIRSNDMEKIANLTFTLGSAPLPTDFLEARRVVSGTTVLNYVSPARLMDLRARSAVQVCDYSIVGQSIQTPPQSSDSVDLLYYGRIDTLKADNPTNWLITRHPDAYFLGCMFYAQTEHNEKEAAAGWKALWDEALVGLTIHSNNKRFSGPLVPEGAVQVAGARV